VDGLNREPGTTLLILKVFLQLVLTVQNTVWSWGASPQVLRLQGQAHKRARAMHAASAEGGAGGAEPAVDTTQGSEAHLTPSLVDTRNVQGKIVQVRIN